MNDTAILIKELKATLKIKGTRSFCKVVGVSHTAIYNMIKNDRITIKFFKTIKTNEKLKGVYISDDYIVNKILMGF